MDHPPPLLRLILCISATLLTPSPGQVPEATPALATRFDAELGRLDTQIAAINARLEKLARIPSEQTGERLGYHSRILQGQASELWVQVDLAARQTFDRFVVVPVVLPREQGGIEGYGFPRRFQVLAGHSPEFSESEGTIVGDFTAEDLPNPGRAPVVIRCPQGEGRFLRFVATGPTGRIGSKGQVTWPSLALAEIMVLQGDRNLAAGRQVTAPTSREAGPVWSLQNLTDSESILGAPVTPASRPRKGWHSIAYPEADTPVSITLDLGVALPVQDVRLFPMRWEGFPHWLGFGFPVRYKVEGSMDVDFIESQIIADLTQADLPNPGMNAVVLPADGLRARMIRITATRLWERFTDHAFALSEVQVFSEGQNAALHTQVQTTSTYPDEPWAGEHLVDGDASDNGIMALPAWVDELQLSAGLEQELLALVGQRQRRLQAWDQKVRNLGWGSGTAVLALLTVFLVRNTRRRHRELILLQQRIARDLHDEVGSNLAGIALLSREAGQTASPPHRRELLDEVSRVADETAASMRDLVWMIQPGAPGDLVGGFRQCASRLLSGMAVAFHPPEEPLSPRLPLDFKRQLYLIYKEALQNVARHSGATKVDISFVREERLMVVRIRDNGSGIPEANANGAAGHGLENMRVRARSLKGEVQLLTPPEGGCEVEIRVPWP